MEKTSKVKKMVAMAAMFASFAFGYFIGHPAQTQAMAIDKPESVVAVEDTEVPTGNLETEAEEEAVVSEEVVDETSSEEIAVERTSRVAYVPTAPIAIEIPEVSGEIVDAIVSTPETKEDDNNTESKGEDDKSASEDSGNNDQSTEEPKDTSDDKTDDSNSEDNSSDNQDQSTEDSKDTSDNDKTDSDTTTEDNSSDNQGEVVTPPATDEVVEPTPVGEVYYKTSEIFDGKNPVRIITEGFQDFSDGTTVRVSTVSCFVDYYEYTGEARPEENVPTEETVEMIENTEETSVVVEGSLDNAEVEVETEVTTEMTTE